ncbi:OPT family small oligopeptide transporter [Kwoniella bestiolae CBS 10118]|uniref:OPT family small oligopeptide transporter n=1 Tax=Kwoniella bestiolae CBS 10118 TaxID=1296100 RepID=A0A1B9G224_9TREE|nr:OPT family small oligopeptide transporter [Kwoniella bestiolae CBS 10118]OCF25070.1 OPT family small oligopeptide transporter [Kwoniella bestiolae CBS 10118]
MADERDADLVPELPQLESEHSYDEKHVQHEGVKGSDTEHSSYVVAVGEAEGVKVAMHLELGMTEEEAARLEAACDAMTLERTIKIVNELVLMHQDDPNFSGTLLQDMIGFIGNPDILASPDNYSQVIHSMKMEAVLATENSPYVEVRANVDPTDDPSMPVSTIRAWAIGIVFCIIGSFIDNLFAFRNPAISIGTNVAQLAAYPLGVFLARVLPDRRFQFLGEHSLNPGKFSSKEHMLISIMANISFTAPYTFYIIPVQAMPQYFNQSFAYNRGYQILLSLAVNLFGYGLAGLLRRFLVYPSVAIWPATLNTVALVKAFHQQNNEAVPGPFGRIYRASREKIFLVGTLCMFFYFFFPSYIFQALSTFSWMTWISPDNVNLTAVTGIWGGLGLNPWPTFDWNMFGGTGLYLPTFAVANQVVGILIGAVMILAVWFTNTWNTGYLPINSNGTFDNTGGKYNVTSVLNSATGKLDENLYRSYSQPFFSAGYIVYNIWAFASYSASFSYVFLFYRRDIARGFRGVYRSLFKKVEDDDLEEDVHYRLMKHYKEVPDWYYLILLVLPIAFGCGAIAGWPTHAPVAALFYGLILPIVFILPLGIIQAVTGIPVALNILANIIGGAITAGQANALMYFKVWGYLSSWQALSFCNDLKLAHYLKIPPRVTFSAQIVATIIYSIVSALQYNFIMDIKDVCTSDAAFRFTCPSQTSFYTSIIFWGIISPKKLFGKGQQYNMMLLGFPLGFILVGLYWALRRKYPKSSFLRQVHPVMLCMGPVNTAAPYNLAYYLGNLYVNLISFQYIRKRYLAFWSKWNYVISAAFSCGIALSGLFIFFTLQIPKGGNIAIDWWGNNVVNLGCEGQGGCPRLDIPEVGYFGPAPGDYF